MNAKIFDKLYLCGGAVRDILSNKKPKDMDYVVMTSSFNEMRSLILEAGGKIFQERQEFQIIRGSLPDIGPADFALPRKEAYNGERQPSKTDIVDSLFQDSLRRDFTINAMYQNVKTGEVIDYHGGVEHLKCKHLYTVGNAEERFFEDPLRMIRAIRFYITKDMSYISQNITGLFEPVPPKKRSDFSDLDDELEILYMAKFSDNQLKLFGHYRKTVSIERTMEELKKCFMHNTMQTIGFLSSYSRFFKEIGIFDNENSKIVLIPTISNKNA